MSVEASGARARPPPRRAISAEESLLAIRAAASVAAEFSIDWQARRTGAEDGPTRVDVSHALEQLDVSSLSHELSAHIPQDPPERHARYGVSCLEDRALRAWQREVNTDRIGLSELLSLGRLLGPGVELRERDIFGADRSGACVIRFCDAATAVAHLAAHLDRDAAEVDISRRLAAAFYEYVLLNNLHCFKDGNGRMSRILLNHRIDAILGAGPYIPFKEAFLLSRGGHEIRLRIVELRGDWEPFMRYMWQLLAMLMPLPSKGGA